jgi:uncharacterized protein (TIGR01244 family)
MAKIVELEPGISVASQLVEADFAELAARGFRTVVANRPDGEADDQLPHREAELAARANGLHFVYQPVWNFDITDEDAVDAFAASMRELKGPILFYCRSGNRCTWLWAQASAERLGVNEVIAVATQAGYDGAAIRIALEEREGLIAA